jgi:hypothetical protein
MSVEGKEQVTAILRDIPYYGRSAWVAVKQTLGVSRGGDRTFYIDKFARALRTGSLGRKYKIMATGKNDGVGSQAQAAMSAICFAEAFGLEYVHRPFESIEHPEGDMGDWVRRCEAYFNLGQAVRNAAECGTPIVPLDQLLQAPNDWPGTVVVAAPHYLHFCNRESEAWERALPTLKTRYRENKPTRQRHDFTIAMHMRRGDVSRANKKVAKNFTPDTVFLNTIEKIIRAVRKRFSDPRICLHSQGDLASFAAFERVGCDLHLNVPALETHAALVDADVLIMSKGAFSYTAGLLNEGVTLYDPQKYRPLRHWIARGRDGTFDEELFLRRLDEVLARRPA